MSKRKIRGLGNMFAIEEEIFISIAAWSGARETNWLPMVIFSTTRVFYIHKPYMAKENGYYGHNFMLTRMGTQNLSIEK